jgi:26S proteasome regulatory subunit N1
LEYRLKGSQEPLESWGHEYVRHLAGEISREYSDRMTSSSALAECNELIALAQEIIPYNMSHNAEAEACDLLMEIERLDLLDKHVDEATYSRVCLYLTSCVNYVPEPEDSMLLKTALAIYKKFNQPADAMVLAIRLNDMELVQEIFTTCDDPSVQKQLAFMLGRQQICLELDPSMANAEDLTEIMQNIPLNNNFLSLAREVRNCYILL